MNVDRILLTRYYEWTLVGTSSSDWMMIDSYDDDDAGTHDAASNVVGLVILLNRPLDPIYDENKCINHVIM